MAECPTFIPNPTLKEGVLHTEKAIKVYGKKKNTVGIKMSWSWVYEAVIKRKNEREADQHTKKTRFQRLGKRPKPTYISSVGFKEGEHIVHNYN